eukprot:Pgem_evm1s12472
MMYLFSLTLLTIIVVTSANAAVTKGYRNYGQCKVNPYFTGGKAGLDGKWCKKNCFLRNGRPRNS